MSLAVQRGKKDVTQHAGYELWFCSSGVLTKFVGNVNRFGGTPTKSGALPHSTDTVNLKYIFWHCLAPKHALECKFIMFVLISRRQLVKGMSAC